MMKIDVIDVLVKSSILLSALKREFQMKILKTALKIRIKLNPH